MEFIFIFILFLPFIFLLWLANIADQRRAMTPSRKGVAALVYVLLIGMWTGLLVAAFVILLMGVAYNRYADLAVMEEIYRAQGVDPATMVALMQSFPRLGAGLMVLAAVGLLTLVPATRRLLARALAISPNSMVHAVALSYSVLIFVNLWLMLASESIRFWG